MPSPLEAPGRFAGAGLGLSQHLQGIIGMKPGSSEAMSGAGLWGRGVLSQAVTGYRRGVGRNVGGGILGAAGRLGQHLGFGFDPSSFLNEAGAIQTKAIKSAMPFFETFSGGTKLAHGLMNRGGTMTREALSAELAPMMRGLSSRRWAAGGWAGAALVGAGTLGFGNIARVGMGYGAGAALGAGAMAMMSGKASRVGRAAFGARWGGRVGAAVQVGRIMFGN